MKILLALLTPSELQPELRFLPENSETIIVSTFSEVSIRISEARRKRTPFDAMFIKFSRNFDIFKLVNQAVGYGVPTIGILTHDLDDHPAMKSTPEWISRSCICTFDSFNYRAETGHWIYTDMLEKMKGSNQVAKARV